MLQWEPENYGTERQHHSVFNVIVTSQTKLIGNLLNHLSSLKCLSGYHAAKEYYKTKY